VAPTTLHVDYGNPTVVSHDEISFFHDVSAFGNKPKKTTTIFCQHKIVLFMLPLS